MKFRPIAILFAASALAASAQDIALRDCPEAVRKTIDRHAQGGRIDEIEKRRTSAGIRYVVDIDFPDKRELTLRIHSRGRVLLAVEDLSYAACPPKVRAAIDKIRKPTWSIDDIDRRKAGGTTTYLVEFDRPAGHDVKFSIKPNGKIIFTTHE